MNNSTMKLQIQKGKDLITIDINAGTTLLELKQKFQQRFKHLSISRQCFKLSNNVLDQDHQTLVQHYGVASGSVLTFKDFGPQIGYRTVFIVEYLGPLLFVLLYSTRPSWVYPKNEEQWNATAWLGLLCWTVHFLKRELETVFIHRFSRPTMPLFNLFKNSAYYWGFGLAVGYPLCHPLYTAPASSTQIQVGLAIFVVSEILNFCTHVQFRSMRPTEGSKLRPIPKGPLFSLVSCPNYTFEVLSWVGFSLMTQIFVSYVFTVIGFIQMTDWALKKHRGYIKSYGDDYKKLRRKAIVPFVI